MKTAATTKLLKNSEGAQLVEFAFALPFLVVILVGILDFGQAYNLKQKLNNATREAARMAASQNSGVNNLTTSDVTAIASEVQSYLTNASVTKCTINTTPAVSGFVYTFTSGSAGCTGGNFQLIVDRSYTFLNGTTTVVGTHVTLTYPFTWTLGQVIGLILPSSTLALPGKFSTDSIIQNIN
jgi:Flp pilus assembly protein TadG